MILRSLRSLHRWLGLLLLLPLVVQGVSGAVLTLEPPLRTTFATATTPGEAAPINAILAAAREAVAADLRPTRYLPPPAPARAAEIWFTSPGRTSGREAMILRIDPVTLAPLGPAQPSGGVLEWIRRLHTNFLVPDLGGRAIVGWVGVGLVILSLIGIPLWWPKPGQWREAFTIAPAARGVRFQRRLHGAAGIWTLTLLLLTSTTGAVLGFPQTIRAALGLPAGGPPRQARIAPQTPPLLFDLDAAAALARNAAPGKELRGMVLPAGAADPIRIFLAPPAREGAVSATTVTVDAGASQVIAVQGPGAMGTADMALRWMHDLHEGQGLGLLWRALTFATGLALPLMAVTGATMWLLRRRNRNRIELARRAALQGGS